MKAREYIGVLPPLMTPFTADGEVYEKGLRSLIQFILPHVHGLYPIGTYGSGPHMTPDERKKVLEIILDEVAGRAPVVAHVGCADTKTTIDLARHAKKSGAAGAGAISPYYNPHLSDDDLYGHFAAVVDAVNETEFPFFVYNNAHYSQNAVSPRVLARLAERGLRGVKDSSFDIVNFFNYQDAVSSYPDFQVIVGTEAFFMGAFEAGATGMVCGMGNIYPELMREMYDKFLAGNRDEAMTLQRKVLKLRAINKAAPTVAIMHYILRLRGVDAGHPRAPYFEIGEKTKAFVKNGLEELGLL